MAKDRIVFLDEKKNGMAKRERLLDALKRERQQMQERLMELHHGPHARKESKVNIHIRHSSYFTLCISLSPSLSSPSHSSIHSAHKITQFDCLACFAPVVGRTEDTAIVAAKGNDYQIDGRTQNGNVGIGWTHQKGNGRLGIFVVG